MTSRETNTRLGASDAPCYVCRHRRTPNRAVYEIDFKDGETPRFNVTLCPKHVKGA